MSKYFKQVAEDEFKIVRNKDDNNSSLHNKSDTISADGQPLDSDGDDDDIPSYKKLKTDGNLYCPDRKQPR